MRGARISTLAVSIAAATMIGTPSALASDAPAQLTGHGHGQWQSKTANPDTGTQRILHGHGRFTIGAAKIRGVISEPGFIAQGSCGVAVRLVTDTGAIKIVGRSKTLARDELVCRGGPVRFHFHSTKTTGDLMGASYKGIGHFDLENASTDVTDNGTFTLRLKALS